MDYQKVVRDTIKHIGYDDSDKGKNSQTSGVSVIWKSVLYCVFWGFLITFLSDLRF